MSLDDLENLGGFQDVMETLPAELRADKDERGTVASLARKLPRESVIRRTTERILRGSAGEAEAARALRDATVERSGFRWRDRILAAWCLGLTNPEDSGGRSDALASLGTLANNGLERDNFGAFLRLQWRALILTVPYFLLMRGMDSVFAFNPFFLIRLFFTNLAFSMLALPVSMMIERRRMNLARAAAILSLGRMRAAEGTGVVAAAVYDKVGEGSSEVKKAAERALPTVLSALTDEHYGRVRSTSIDYLCRILQDKRNHLVLAALEALAKVGGGSASEAVARLVKRTKAPDVRAAAQRVLPILENRRKEGLLLRATAPPASDEDVLLRAMTPELESDPSVLLRPSGGDAAER